MEEGGEAGELEAGGGETEEGEAGGEETEEGEGWGEERERLAKGKIMKLWKL